MRLPHSESICGDGEYGVFEGSADDEVVHGHYRREGTWSPEIQELLADLLFPEGRGTFLDIGANIGLVSIPLAERRRVRCVAFEPEPRNFQWLERNIARHELGSLFTTFNLALHSEEARLSFELSASNAGDHRVRGAALPEEGAERTLIEVPAGRLDDLVRIEDLPRPIVAKLDTQGAELRVLRGAERSLPHIDHLICEFWPYGLRRMGDSAEELIGLFRDFAYGAILRLDEVSGRLPPVDRLCARLEWLPTDGSDQGFFDVLVARHAELPPRIAF
jgi:FkbM family methyltransferase